MQPNPRKILFVEDEADLIDIYHTVFDVHGYVFFSTADIDEALLIAERERPDAVLLDIILPEVSGGTVDLSAKQGFKFLERFRENPKIKDIPVIVLTNLTSQQDRKRARELGAIDFLVKADHLPETIFKRVEELIERGKGRVRS